MNAVIKIVSFLVFGGAVATGNGYCLLAGALLVLPLYAGGGGQLAHALKILRRLRWLFLSILVVYVFFTPGRLLWPELSSGPTYEGLAQGGLRVAVLILLVLAVNWVIDTTEQNRLLAGILWCLRPLSILGVSPERLAVRISLTLEAVQALRGDYREQPRLLPDHSRQARRDVITATAWRLFTAARQRAETAPLVEIELPDTSAPPLWQWLIPLLLSLVFISVQVYGAVWQPGHG